MLVRVYTFITAVAAACWSPDIVFAAFGPVLGAVCMGGGGREPGRCSGSAPQHNHLREVSPKPTNPE